MKKFFSIKDIAALIGFTLLTIADVNAVSCPSTIAGTSLSSIVCDITLPTLNITSAGEVDGVMNQMNTTTSLTNVGSINGNNGMYGVYNSVTIVTLNNSGAISAVASGTGIGNDGTITTLTNNTGATISSGVNGLGVYSSGNIGSLNNSGAISAGDFGTAIANDGTITTLTNIGSITTGVGGTGIFSDGAITTLTNIGSITAGDGGTGIFSVGTITVMNNAQGGNGSLPSTTALTYRGNLPQNYNIIIRGPAQYGQLAVSSPIGATTFGIYSGGVAGVAASTLNKGTYSSVLSGVTQSNLNNTTGNYNGFTWRLNNSSGSIWDLIVTGASTVDTQQSLVNTSATLQNTFTLQNSVLANSFTYDCNVFGANDVCVSAGGRNTQVSATNGLNNTSALLIAAYRVMPSVRVGAYVDQNLSVNNAGSTVNLGNNTPLIGLFGAWNERLDGTGTEVKVSAAYGQKNTTVTRQVVGTSEAGSGSSQLNSQGTQLTAKYGFGFTPDVIVSPYVGMRYTQNNMGGYTEGTSSSVTAPLTYSALNTNSTTVLAGVGASYRGIPQTTLFASAGVESDTNTQNGSVNATGVSGLTPVNFNPNPVKTRPTAMVGAAYDVEKNQRLGVTGIYRQEAYQATATTTVMATYTVGF